MAAERRKRLLNAALDAEEFTRLGQELVRIPSLLDFARVRKSLIFRLSVAWLQDIQSCNGAVSLWGVLTRQGLQPFGGQDIEEVLQSMSSDDCLCVWDALTKHVADDFNAEHQVARPALQNSCQRARNCRFMP